MVGPLDPKVRKFSPPQGFLTWISSLKLTVRCIFYLRFFGDHKNDIDDIEFGLALLPKTNGKLQQSVVLTTTGEGGGKLKL